LNGKLVGSPTLLADKTDVPIGSEIVEMQCIGASLALNLSQQNKNK
jgi:hypothetical protein